MLRDQENAVTWDNSEWDNSRGLTMYKSIGFLPGPKKVGQNARWDNYRGVTQERFYCIFLQGESSAKFCHKWPH